MLGCPLVWKATTLTYCHAQASLSVLVRLILRPGTKKYIYFNRAYLFYSAHWLRPCFLQLLQYYCSDEELFQLLAHAFKWKKSKQVRDSLIKCQLVEIKFLFVLFL